LHTTPVSKMDIQSDQVRTWDNLEHSFEVDKTNFNPRLKLVHVARGAKKGFLSLDSQNFQQSINNLTALFDNGVHPIDDKKVVTTIFEAVVVGWEVFHQHPQIVPQESFDSLFKMIFHHIGLFSRNMQIKLEAMKNHQSQLVKETHPLDLTAPKRLQLAESVLSRRTNRILLVLDRCYDIHNIQAILRTAECLGIQYIYIVLPVEVRGKIHSGNIVDKANHFFLTVKEFQTSQECLIALQEEGRTIWATDLSAQAVSLDGQPIVIPNKLALVMGRESDGCSSVFLEAAQKRVYLPIHGFTESLNLSVATALIVQQLLHMCPEARGNLNDSEKAQLRESWFNRLAPKRELEIYKRYVTNPPDLVQDLRRESSPHVPPKVAKRIRDKEDQIQQDLKKLKSENLQHKMDIE